MPNGRVFFLDKLENYTQLRTPDGYYAMSSEYDPETNTAVPLTYETNAFCSGGTFLADGSVISVGGNAALLWLDPNIGDGFTAIRHLTRSSTDDTANGAGWVESANNKLASARWYASAQTVSQTSLLIGRIVTDSSSCDMSQERRAESSGPSLQGYASARKTNAKAYANR